MVSVGITILVGAMIEAACFGEVLPDEVYDSAAYMASIMWG